MSADRGHIEALESRRIFCATLGAGSLISAAVALPPAMAAAPVDQEADTYSYEVARATAADGSTYVLESTSSDDGSSAYDVRKTKADGSADTTFGDGGALALAAYDVTSDGPAKGWSTETYSDYSDLKVDSAGNVLVVGSSNVSSWSNSDDDDSDPTYASSLTLTRITSAGRVDGSYGADGVATLSLGDSSSFIGLGVGKDGAAYVLVETDDADYNAGYSITRLGAGGTVDGSFGNGGMTSLPALSQSGDGYASYSSIAVLADGSTIAVGQSYSYGANDIWAPPTSVGIATKVSALGELDGTFGAGGTATFGLPSAYFAPSAVTSDAQGNLTFAIDFGDGATADVARLTGQGLADPTFASDQIPDQFAYPTYFYVGADPLPASTEDGARGQLDSGAETTPDAPASEAKATAAVASPAKPVFSSAPIEVANAGQAETLFGSGKAVFEDQSDALPFLG